MLEDDKPQGLPDGVDMFPTKVLCIKDLKSNGNEIMKKGDSYFTKDKRYNVYVDNRNYKDGGEVLFYVTNDAGHKHIIGNYGDLFFNLHFYPIKEEAFCQRMAKVKETRKMKLIWVPF